MTFLIYAAAAIAEIAGCFAFWAWLKSGKSIWWIAPGLAALVAFAWLLTMVPSSHAGRAYAAYGGIYISASLLWLWLVEKQIPDKWDITCVSLALTAAAIILFAPRAAG